MTGVSDIVFTVSQQPPVLIDRASARELSPRLGDALEIVCNEFEGLDPYRQYRNAFSRVLKPDPLGRVLMMGTDQRDLFVPLLRQAVTRHVPAGGHIFDFGAGDGQTFALVADAVPPEVTVSIEEPNPGYVRAYQALLRRHRHLRSGVVIEAGFDDLESVAASRGIGLPDSGSVDLVLGLHMIYFAADIGDALRRMARLVRPGGAFFCVATDELTSYSGAVLREFIESGGDTGNNDSHLAALDDRRRLLAPDAEGGGALAELLRADGIDAEVESVRQPSRMYGHTLADLLAVSIIGALGGVAGTGKFEIAAKTLLDRSEEVDLRIETAGPRTGMWSVVQPQWVTQIRRC